MKPLKIKVTQKDIDNGIKNSCWDCPIALAIKRQIKDGKTSVTLSRVYLNNVKYILPEIAQYFIYDYDNGKPVTTFEFELCPTPS